MSITSHVNPYTLFLNEKVDENLWEEAQDYFDFVYGREINEDIEYHSAMEYILKEKKQKLIREIYDQKLKEKEVDQ